MSADEATSFFSSLQVGVATIGGGGVGVEALVHAVRQASLDLGMDPRKIMLKVDFKNAFNMISREAILLGVREHFPGLYRWAEFCYAQPGLLFFGGSVLKRELGVHQGDPLGPLLFSVVLHSLVRLIEERVLGLDVHVWYLDDGTIIGDIDLVVRALSVIECGPRLGAHLNHEKSEIWWPSREDDVGVFPSHIVRVPICGVKLLWSPISSREFMTDFLERRVEKVTEVHSILEEMDDA